MLSKSKAGAMTLALALLAGGCARILPWRDAPAANEVNLAFTLEQNLIHLQTVRINNRTGRYILGSAAPRTILDDNFPGAGPHALQISEKETVRLAPAKLDLGNVADAIIGVEAWGNRAISIDYRSGLVTYQKEGIHRGLMSIYQFQNAPMINAMVNGRQISAVVDTTNPDTLILPARTTGRGTARVSIANHDFGVIDVYYANVTEPRVGNRLLSRFLVTIDYGKRVVGLWRDPRIGGDA